MRLLLVVPVLAFFPLDAVSDARAGEKKAELCRLCHRTGGQFGTGIPLLEGRSKESLVADITAFKSGKRRSPAMDPSAERLTARDIADSFAARPAAPEATPAPLSAW
jgi:cytochrome c553